nr:A24 family peptidase [uncultured Rhodopila sp.]
MSTTALVQIITILVPATGILLLLAAALQDIATRTIPNGLVVGVAGIGFIRQIVEGSALPGLLAFAVVLIAAILCWRGGFIGGGDAKLLAAASLMVFPGQVLALIPAIAIGGGLLSLLYLIVTPLCTSRRPAAKSRARWLFARILRVERHRLRHGITLPYAAAIAAGTIFVVWRG